ncbi:MAG: glycosyltransferase [Bacteroidales bacterium]|nr:glycosyltransferase [Bacteroidales bacterium]
MKICISVTNDVITDQRLERTVRTLMTAGHEVRAIGRKRQPTRTKIGYPCPVRLFSLLFNKGPLFYAEYNFRLLLFLLLAKVDVMLACDLDTLPANYLAAGIRGKTLVYDSHEYFTEVPELIGRPGAKKIWEWMEKRMLPHIRNIYTVSASIAEAYKATYGIPVQVVFNFPYRGKSLRQPDFSLKREDEHIILYQGSVNIGRGLELALLAMKFVENARLVIIGDGDILVDLMQLCDTAELAGRVTFCGRVPAHQLALYTIQADLGISLEEDLGLNYRYALPNKLFDYIQACVPVLVSDLPEMSAVVKKYNIGRTIRTTDPRELAACFASMLDDDSERRRWKENLRTAADELCWEKEESKLLQVFNRLT